MSSGLTSDGTKCGRDGSGDRAYMAPRHYEQCLSTLPPPGTYQPRRQRRRLPRRSPLIYNRLMVPYAGLRGPASPPAILLGGSDPGGEDSGPSSRLRWCPPPDFPGGSSPFLHSFLPLRAPVLRCCFGGVAARHIADVRPTGARAGDDGSPDP